MARSKRMSVQKRLRERKKAEAAELKRELRSRRSTTEPTRGATVAAREDLEGYGVLTPEESEQS